MRRTNCLGCSCLTSELSLGCVAVKILWYRVSRELEVSSLSKLCRSNVSRTSNTRVMVLPGIKKQIWTCIVIFNNHVYTAQVNLATNVYIIPVPHQANDRMLCKWQLHVQCFVSGLFQRKISWRGGIPINFFCGWGGSLKKLHTFWVVISFTKGRGNGN